MNNLLLFRITIIIMIYDNDWTGLNGAHTLFQLHDLFLLGLFKGKCV